MTPETAKDYLRLRRGILDHVKDGNLSWFDASLFTWLCLEADPRYGIARTCAPVLAAECRTSLHRVRRSLHHLLDIGWILYDEYSGQRGVYPIVIFKYPLERDLYTPSRDEWLALRGSDQAADQANDLVSDWVSLVRKLRATCEPSCEPQREPGREPSCEPSKSTHPRGITGTNRTAEKAPCEPSCESSCEPACERSGEPSASHPLSQEEEGEREEHLSPSEGRDRDLVAACWGLYVRAYEDKRKGFPGHSQPKMHEHLHRVLVCARTRAKNDGYPNPDKAMVLAMVDGALRQFFSDPDPTIARKPGFALGLFASRFDDYFEAAAARAQGGAP